MDDFFKFVSKAVIIIPIATVILALILKFNQNQKNNFSSYQLPILTPTINISMPPTKKLDKKIEKIGINLNDHWLCQYKLNNDFYRLEINKRKIILEANVSGKYEKYDLSPYGFMIESFLNMDINKLESMASSYLPKGASFKELVQSCKKL